MSMQTSVMLMEATLLLEQQAARIEALEAALEAMCVNMKNDGHAYRDCYIRARAALAPEQDK